MNCIVALIIFMTSPLTQKYPVQSGKSIPMGSLPVLDAVGYHPHYHPIPKTKERGGHHHRRRLLCNHLAVSTPLRLHPSTRLQRQYFHYQYNPNTVYFRPTTTTIMLVLQEVEKND
jgi:hypothetical protein